MTHFPLVEYEDATDPIVKEVYEQIISELGFGIIPNIFKSMAINPQLLEANWKKFRSTMLQGDVPRLLKEMVAVTISQHNNCVYVLKVHLHGLSALGMSEEILSTLVSNFAECPLPEREKAVIQFGLLAATDPLAVKASHYQRLYDLGLDQSEIFEIIATADLFSGINRYADAIALEIDAL